MALRPYGYRYGVYLRIVRLVLAEKGLTADHVTIDPFSNPPAWYPGLDPFGRVPVPDHDGFVVDETAAIARYLDDMFPDPPLQPNCAGTRARMAQVIGIADAFAYWPMVRQVYSHGAFRQAIGEAVDDGNLADGLAASDRVLAALEPIAKEGLLLVRGAPTLADLHLAPMFAAFAAVPDGAARLAEYPALAGWFHSMAARRAMVATEDAVLRP
jgi:glutathione S-transferase